VSSITSSWDAATADELAALDALGAGGKWELGGRVISLSNLDKVFSRATERSAPVTKRDLVRYAAQIAPTIGPYLAGRPLNVNRLPNGVESKGFWQKAVPSHAPDWLQRWRYVSSREHETEWYVVPDGAPALAWMANSGVVELHAWTSTAASQDEPTYALIDIDPGDRTTFEEIVLLAHLYEVALRQLELIAAPKVTGKRGVQIWVPIRPGYTFHDTTAWVEKLSRTVGRVVPDLISWSWRKEDRGGKARLDYTQNSINKTLVAPYSPRAALGLPVSVPITWEELHDPALRPDRWVLASVIDRVRAVGDPFAVVLGVEQDLPAL